jgi:predicted glycosyltransferase
VTERTRAADEPVGPSGGASGVCRRHGLPMRVWIDVTNSPQVVFFRPLVGLLEQRGHAVAISARDFAQTLELLEDAGMAHTVVGPPHGGASRSGKARAMAARLRALRVFGRQGGFDVALSHASHELPLAARSLGIPSAYAYDYEFARAQHTLGSRAATRVVVPDAIPQERLDRLGAHARKVRRYPGLKEEYALAGFAPDPAVPAALGLDPERVQVVVRTPPEVSLYHRHGNPLFAELLERLGRDPAVQAVVLPRTPEQREAIAARGLPSLVVPTRAVDARTLVALADAVVSAGGTMNREAVALGAPVWTTFAGRMGAVDEGLVADGRLRLLVDAASFAPAKRVAGAHPPFRDPALMLDLLLTALEG